MTNLLTTTFVRSIARMSYVKKNGFGAEYTNVLSERRETQILQRCVKIDIEYCLPGICLQTLTKSVLAILPISSKLNA